MYTECENTFNRKMFDQNRTKFMILFTLSMIVLLTIISSYFAEKSITHRVMASIWLNVCSINFGYYDFHCYPSDDLSNTNSNNGRGETYRIVLFGDSLIQVANKNYNLASNIMKKLHVLYPYIKFEMIVSAIGGNRIKDLRNRLYTDCLAYKPHSVIMYWDSDICDIDIDYITANQTKQIYKENLQFVLEQMLENNVVHIAVSGPGLLGELPHGQNAADGYADEYMNINRVTALTTMKGVVDYIDIRNAFFDYNNLQLVYNNNKPLIYNGIGRKGTIGNLTVDGEHPTALGSAIEEKVFYTQLISWYKVLNCEKLFGNYDFHCYPPYDLSSSNTNSNNGRGETYRIVLFGDSLIQVANKNYNLASNIMSRLAVQYPYIKFEMIVSAIGGNRIKDLRNRLYTDCLAYKPHSVIMYWDSDISFRDIDYITANQTKQIYKENLQFVLEQMLENNVVHIAVAGPGLLGELPHGQNAADGYADEYMNINRVTALTTMKGVVDYIDIRNAFFDYNNLQLVYNNNKPLIYNGIGRKGTIGNLTVDGEHPTALGSAIEEKVFYTQLISWYNHSTIP